MPYTPKFCCQCGEKIEQAERKFWNSRRFCQLCATEYGIYDKLPMILIGVSVLFGLWGFGQYWRTPEKTLSVAPNQFVAAQDAKSAEPNRTNPSPQISPDTTVQTPVQTKTEIVPAKQNLKIEQTETSAQETVYFCGAQTKKGTPCSRRVKTAARCWQHEGQTAMLPQEKLIVRK